jgi:hypothetical protein
MGELTARAAWLPMSASNSMRDGLRHQVDTLHRLLTYLEERDRLDARDFMYCQAALRDALKQLARLDHLAEEETWQSGS